MAISLVSCDKDFNEIGTDIIGDDHYGFEKDDASTVTAKSIPTGAVQTDGLAINPLGVYSNPVFGTTTANFVTQVSLASNSTNREFDETAVITDVTLHIPYYATLEETNTDGSHEYTLDSIYGSSETKLDLKIFESNYFLRELSHSGSEVEAERYYNDLNADIDNVKGPQLNTRNITSENTEFVFSKQEIDTTITDDDGDETTTRTPPGMHLKLSKSYFTSKLINAPAGSLANNNVFHNYLRGIYFKVANPSNATGVMNMMNFSAGTITVKYTEVETTTVTNSDGTTTTTSSVEEQTPITLNLTGKTVSLLNYQNPLPAVPANRLVVKGGQGYLTTIKLFGEEDVNNNGIPDQLDEIKNNNWMINEANLIFYVDRDIMTPAGSTAAAQAPEPNRIYLYDAKNNQPIADYSYDNSTNSDPKRIKGIYGGILRTDDDFTDAELESLGISDADPDNKRGVLYKIRVTNYLRALLITADSTNVTLGLSVSESISESGMHKLKTPIDVSPVDPLQPEFTQIKELPKAGVMHPLGTVLYGPNIPAGDPDYNKRLKLVIYYTKPNTEQ